jgi:hypothetical protein
VVTDEEISYITKSYVLLHANRQDHQLNSKKQSHLDKVSQQLVAPQFKPQTNPNNKDYKKELGGEELSYHDYLI